MDGRIPTVGWAVPTISTPFHSILHLQGTASVPFRRPFGTPRRASPTTKSCETGYWRATKAHGVSETLRGAELPRSHAPRGNERMALSGVPPGTTSWRWTLGLASTTNPSFRLGRRNPNAKEGKPAPNHRGRSRSTQDIVVDSLFSAYILCSGACVPLPIPSVGKPRENPESSRRRRKRGP